MAESYLPYKIANNRVYPWRVDRNGPRLQVARGCGQGRSPAG